jgi:hypothetical protein
LERCSASRFLKEVFTVVSDQRNSFEKLVCELRRKGSHPTDCCRKNDLDVILTIEFREPFGGDLRHKSRGDERLHHQLMIRSDVAQKLLISLVFAGCLAQ